MQIIKTRCVTCHSQNPTHTMFLNQPPPKDLAFDRIDEVRQGGRPHYGAGCATCMPLGNETAMEDEERAKFDAWITAVDAANRRYQRPDWCFFNMAEMYADPNKGLADDKTADTR